MVQAEDIIDTGATLKRVVARLQEAGAASVKVALIYRKHRVVRSATRYMPLGQNPHLPPQGNVGPPPFCQYTLVTGCGLRLLALLRWWCCSTRRLAGRWTSSPTTALCR